MRVPFFREWILLLYSLGFLMVYAQEEERDKVAEAYDKVGIKISRDVCGVVEKTNRCLCGKVDEDPEKNLYRPWTVEVQLVIEDNPRKVRTCIGTVIASNIIITSHRCVLIKGNARVGGAKYPFMPGTELVRDLSRIHVTSKRRHFRIPVQDILPDPRFYRDKWWGEPAVDIAALIVDYDFSEPDSNIWPICIPTYVDLSGFGISIDKFQSPLLPPPLADKVKLTDNDGITQLASIAEFISLPPDQCNQAIGYAEKMDADKVKCIASTYQWVREMQSGNPIVYKPALGSDIFYLYSAAMGVWSGKAPLESTYYIYFPTPKYVLERIDDIFRKSYKYFPTLCTPGSVFGLPAEVEGAFKGVADDFSKQSEGKNLTFEDKDNKFKPVDLGDSVKKVTEGLSDPTKLLFGGSKIKDKPLDRCGARESKHRCQCGVETIFNPKDFARPWTLQILFFNKIKPIDGEEWQFELCPGTIIASNIILVSHRCVLHAKTMYSAPSSLTNPYNDQHTPVKSWQTTFRIIILPVTPRGVVLKVALVTKIIYDYRFTRDSLEGAPTLDIAALVVDGLGADYTSISTDSGLGNWPVCIPDKNLLDYTPVMEVLITTKLFVTLSTRFTRKSLFYCNEKSGEKITSDSIWCAEADIGTNLYIGEGCPIYYYDNLDPEEDVHRYYYIGAVIKVAPLVGLKQYIYWASLEHTLERVDDILMKVADTSPTLCMTKIKPWAFLEGQDNVQAPYMKRDMSLDCECGKEDGGQRGRVLGGEGVDPHKYPWMAKVFNGDMMCGGTIISDRVILTSGHCVLPKVGLSHEKTAIGEEIPTKGFTVIIGSHKQDKKDPKIDDGVKIKEDKIKKIIAHPGYYDVMRFTGEYGHDVALIILKEKINFSEMGKDNKPLYRPICLPEWRSLNIFGQYTTVLGWGQIKRKEGSKTVLEYPEVLQKFRGNIRRKQDCFIGSEWRGYPNQFCVAKGVHHTTSDAGDAGGPASVKVNSKHVQVGVGSFKYERYNETFMPSFFANLVELVPFVDFYSYREGAKYCKS